MRGWDSTQLILWNWLPGPGHTHNQNKPSRAPVPLLPNPHREKQNTLTHPKWLFTWHGNWSSTPYFHFQRKAAVCISFTATVEATGHRAHWTICPLVRSQKRNGQNKTLAGVPLSLSTPWGGWNHPVDSFDMICLNLQNERGHFMGFSRVHSCEIKAQYVLIYQLLSLFSHYLRVKIYSVSNSYYFTTQNTCFNSWCSKRKMFQQWIHLK